MKKIGVLGSGIVAKTLASGFLKHGYDVAIGTRSKEKLADWHGSNQAAQVMSFADAASFADIVVLAVKGLGATEVLTLAGRENLEGKVVIDTTNPIAERAPDRGVLKFFVAQGTSLMETLQAAHPNARFVKAWNSVGNAFMVDPDFGGVKPTMMICGNDASAKQETTDILEQFGWEVEDMGTARSAEVIEQLCILWCLPGFARNQWNHAFKILKKN